MTGTAAEPGALLAATRLAVLWRSGSQIVAQAIAWTSTFLVIRALAPADYGLFAMTQAVLVLLNLMNGFGIASALIRAEQVSERDWRQAFGMLLLLNGGLGVAQFLAAPLAAAWFGQPMVADLLRVQALLYAATPFIALPHAILARRMDFRRPAQVRLIAAVAGAVTALACAYAGFGVWTLVAAPFAIFYVEAAGMVRASGMRVRPSFDFRGAGVLWRFGAAMMASQLFWVVQSQADVAIAGRAFDAGTLGVYTTALMLTQLLATKFVPPLNDVAFAAYARLGGAAGAMAPAFLGTVRLIALVVMPAYLGLAVVAEPLVAVVLGPRWAETAGIVPVLALAMPFLTLQILFAPATNAQGRPGIQLRSTMAGAAIMPLAFLIGVRWGVDGLAWSWLAGMVLLCGVTSALSMRTIGIGAAGLAGAAGPAVAAAAAMAFGVMGVDGMLPALPAFPRLAVLAGAGGVLYLGLLAVLWRPVLAEAWRLVVRGRVTTVRVDG